jgi:hypothetical protein
MKNQVIEVLSIEHGMKVIVFWNLKGVNTGSFVGTNVGGYYGVIDDKFSLWNFEQLENMVNGGLIESFEVIELPKDWEREYYNEPIKGKFPRYMKVWNNDSRELKLLVICKLENHVYPYLAVVAGRDEDYLSGRNSLISSWKYAKEIDDCKQKEETKNKNEDFLCELHKLQEKLEELEKKYAVLLI